jgi:L-amino acid N-acyltransferase YncA
MVELEIRAAHADDFAGIWPIFSAVVAGGDSYAYDPGTTEEQARALWMDGAQETFVVTAAGRVAGTYILRPNAPGLGAHVANAGYMVAPDMRRRGIARAMCLHSLDTARARGFLAMQFNFVVSSNAPAIAVWARCGFRTVGRLPKAFCHRELGLVDVLVMYRAL